MKRFAITFITLLIAASAYAQTGMDGRVGHEVNLARRTSFCLWVHDRAGDPAVRGPLKAALLRQAELFGFPARDCELDEPSAVTVRLLVVGAAISVQTSVVAFDGVNISWPIVWSVTGLTVGGNGPIADRAWPLVLAQFEQVVLAWRDANP